MVIRLASAVEIVMVVGFVVVLYSILLVQEIGA